MPIAPIKKSALPEVDTIADDDYLDGIDQSAATPATKNKRFSFTKIATWILSKFAVPSQAEAEAGEATTARLWTAERVAQAIAALGADAGLSESEVNALIAAALTAFLTDEDFEAAVNALIDSALEGIEGGGLSESAVNALIAAALTAFLADEDFNTAVNALIDAALEEFEPGGGSTLPVNDTTALVKDPVDATKLVRLDAGNVPTETTVVLQSPGVSAVVGLIVIERSITGTPINTGSHLVMVATRPGRVVGASAYATGAGDYPVYLQVTRNGSNQGSPMGLTNADGYSSGNRYGRDGLDFNFAAGDVLEFEVLTAGGSEYGGSGSGGTPMSGTIVFQLEAVYSPQ
jgi:hypothetical protein